MTIINKLLDCGIRPLKHDYLPLPLEYIANLEKEFGLLPSDYKQVVSHFGGALFEYEVSFKPIDSRFHIISPTTDPTIDCLYGDIYDGDIWAPLSLRANLEWFRGRIPSETIPIAESGGDLICLGLGMNKFERVYYWDRVEEMIENRNNTYLVANSFAEFIYSLECHRL